MNERARLYRRAYMMPSSCADAPRITGIRQATKSLSLRAALIWLRGRYPGSHARWRWAGDRLFRC